MSILPTQSFRLAAGEEAWGIEAIIGVGVEPADEAFALNMVVVRNGQEKLSNTLQRWYT